MNSKGKLMARNLAFLFIVANGVAIVKADKTYRVFQPVESQEIYMLGDCSETEIRGMMLVGEITNTAL
jgi:hypothetical protein